ncbi:MAG: hypothetical protein QW372_00835 [Nitrososphaerales archaeon]
MLEEADVRRKLKRAYQMLLFQRYKAPGVKGWELKRVLGKDYVKMIPILREDLEKMGLDLKIISERGENIDESSIEDLDKARFFIIFKEPPTQTEIEASGFRIDDLACLAASLAYIITHKGKSPRKDVEQLLKEKFPQWKVDLNLDRFIQKGYLLQDKDDILYIGWRTRAEIDQKTLLSLLLASPTSINQDMK